MALSIRAREWLEVEVSPCEAKMTLAVLKKGLLPLFDANTSINQCHVVALKVAELYAKCREKHPLSEGELKWLMLCLKTCPIVTHSNEAWLKLWALSPLENLSKREREIERQQVQREGKSLNTFALQEECKTALEPALFAIIESQIDRTSPLAEELVSLSKNHALRLPGQRLKTYPKYAGSLWLIEQLKAMENPPWLVVKVKECRGEKSHMTRYLSRRITEPLVKMEGQSADVEACALVIEGVCLQTPYEDYAAIAKKCPHQLLLRDRSLAHLKQVECLACSVSAGEGEGSLEGESLEAILLKVGADFNAVHQPSLVEQLGPLLKERFVHSLGEAQQGYSYAHPHRFVIEHIHPDTLGRALCFKSRLLDHDPQETLTRILEEGVSL